MHQHEKWSILWAKWSIFYSVFFCVRVYFCPFCSFTAVVAIWTFAVKLAGKPSWVWATTSERKKIAFIQIVRHSEWLCYYSVSSRWTPDLTSQYRHTQAEKHKCTDQWNQVDEPSISQQVPWDGCKARGSVERLLSICAAPYISFCQESGINWYWQQILFCSKQEEQELIHLGITGLHKY